MDAMKFEEVRRVLTKVNTLTPAQREIMCLCAVAYEAGRAAAQNDTEKPVS